MEGEGKEGFGWALSGLFNCVLFFFSVQVVVGAVRLVTVLPLDSSRFV